MFIYAWWDRFDLKNEKIIVYCRCGFVGSFLLVSVVNMERSGFVLVGGKYSRLGVY